MIYPMESYRSGHNEADSKSVCRVYPRHEGSNPSDSAFLGTQLPIYSIAKNPRLLSASLGFIIYIILRTPGFESNHIHVTLTVCSVQAPLRHPEITYLVLLHS